MTEYDAAFADHQHKERGSRERSSPRGPKSAERRESPAGHSPLTPGLRGSGRAILLSLAFLLIVAVMAFAIFQPIQVLPRISLAPGYALTDQTGDSFNSEALRGKLTLYTFTHTGAQSQCAAPCVSTSATLAEIERALGPAPAGDIPLHFVALYVDPDHATPATLQAEAHALGVDPERWHLLTGAPEQLKHLIGSGFSTYYGPNGRPSTSGPNGRPSISGPNGRISTPQTPTLEIDPVFVLVDGWGIIRAFYRTATPNIEIIQRDLGLITQEARQSRGVTRYAYEAAHLFLCYPK